MYVHVYVYVCMRVCMYVSYTCKYVHIACITKPLPQHARNNIPNPTQKNNIAQTPFKKQKKEFRPWLIFPAT